MLYANSKCDSAKRLRAIARVAIPGQSPGLIGRLPVAHRPLLARNAFTLVELLVIITILAILASMVLFALAGATESAKDMKTRATIQKISTLVMQKYDTYRTRRVPITIPAGTLPRDAALLRLNALHELMTLEMPDAFNCIGNYDAQQPIGKRWQTLTPKYLTAVPAASKTYCAALNRANVDPNSTTPHRETADCLYLIVTRGLGDPDVLEQFAPNEIADLDGDGINEFVDGWQTPIKFLRWAPAFESPLQPSGTTQRDPFDPLNVNPANPAPPASPITFPLFPLVYSAGPDKLYDTREKPSAATFDIGASPYFFNPFHANLRDKLGLKDQIDGDGTNHVDNITNHDL